MERGVGGKVVCSAGRTYCSRGCLLSMHCFIIREPECAVSNQVAWWTEVYVLSGILIKQGVVC